MNESLFLIHVVLVISFGMLALKLGKVTLSAWIAMQAILANLFVIKQISFFNFHVTCSDVFAIGSIFGLNLLQEYFGKEAAKKALWTCFFSMIFFVVMANVHLLYTPSPYDSTQEAFTAILSPSLRLLLVSLGVFFLVQQIDIRFFGYLQNKFKRVPLAIRNAVSLSCTQFLDTFLFSVFGLWGLVANLTDIIFLSFVIKLLVIALMTPLTLFSKRFVPRAV